MNKYSLLLSKQRKYFNSGKTKPVNIRLKMLDKLKNVILEHEKEIASALNKDLGKSYHESVTSEIGFVLSEINNLKKNIKKWIKKKKVKTNMLNFSSKSYIIKEPYGVILIIGPWNYPFQLTLSPLIGSIAGGNCSILKPSEIASHTADIIEKIIEKTFLEEYVKVIKGGIKETDILLNEKFNKIFFTGSTKIGSIIMKKASKHITPVVLELGGKSPTIIDKDVDMKKTAKRIIFGKCINSGQTCVAPDYILIHKDAKELFYKEYKKAKEKFYGNDMMNNPDYGHIINKKNYERVKSYLNCGNIISGGYTSDKNLHIDLTLLEITDLNSAIMQEEIFGPILPVIIFNEYQEIINIINRNPDPLALYIFSNNKAFINKILDDIRFGGGCVNDTIMHLTNDHLPFGGRGTSGIGKYHGKYSFETFTHEKAVLVGSTRFDLFMKYPPYNEKVLNIIKKFMY